MKKKIMKMKVLVKTVLVLALAMPLIVNGQTVTEPLGGQPVFGAKASVADLAAQVAYQRAFEAVVGGCPRPASTASERVHLRLTA